MNLLNLTLTRLLLKSTFQSPAPFISGNRQTTSLSFSTFSYLSNPIICSNNANLQLNFNIFSKILYTPIKITNNIFDYQNTVYTDPLQIINQDNHSCSITQCLFNSISSTKGNGAIDFESLPLNVVIFSCSFYKCTSQSKNGCFDLNFLNSNNNSFYISISSSCFFECTTESENSNSIFSINVQSIPSSTNISFTNNLLCKNGKFSQSYTTTLSNAKIIESTLNNFTHNKGNLLIFDSISSKSSVSLCSIVNNSSPTSSKFIKFIDKNHFYLENLNILNNNLNNSSFISAESGFISISSIVFLKNIYENFIPYEEEELFYISKSIFDIDPNMTDLDDSNIVIGWGNDTETLSIAHIVEKDCPNFATNESKSGLSISITLLIACVSMVVVAILISGIVIYCRRKIRPNFLTIAEVPDGYEKIFDV